MSVSQSGIHVGKLITNTDINISEKKLQSVTKYLSLTLISCEIKHCKESLIAIFLVLTKFQFWQGDWVLGYHFMKFRHFSNIS